MVSLGGFSLDAKGTAFDEILQTDIVVANNNCHCGSAYKVSGDISLSTPGFMKSVGRNFNWALVTVIILLLLKVLHFSLILFYKMCSGSGSYFLIEH